MKTRVMVALFVLPLFVLLGAAGHAAAGSITGTVTDAGGAPLQGINVAAFLWNGDWWDHSQQVQTGADGRYRLDGLETETYRIEFTDPNGDYATEVFDEAGNLHDGADVQVVSGETTPGIDASLGLGGKIAGTVTDADGVQQQHIDVSAYRYDGNWWQSVAWAQTDADGGYTLGGLLPGLYKVEFRDPIGQLYTQFFDAATKLVDGADVTVNAGETTVGIDAQMGEGGRISGVVTGPGGTPLQDIQVDAYRDWDWMASGETDADGAYTIHGLPPGVFRVEFRDVNDSYVREYYDDVPNMDQAADVPVVAGQTTANINAELMTGGSISGTVTDESGNPLEGIQIQASYWQGEWWDSYSWATTDAYGFYTLGGLPPDSYRVEFQDDNGFYANQVYDGVQNVDDGDDVAVIAGEVTTGIDAQLAVGGRISGVVTGPDDLPLSWVEVSAFRWNGNWWEWMGWAFTDENGDYTLGGLAADAYRIEFWHNEGDYVTQVYAGADHLDDGDDVTVVAGETTTGIDAQLAVAGKISGTVRGPGAQALQGIWVTASRSTGGGDSGDWQHMAGSETDSDGLYTLGRLPAGVYRVEFQDGDGVFARFVFDGAVTLEHGSDVAVVAGETTGGIDATLDMGGGISGMVVDAGGEPLPHISVTASLWIEDDWWWMLWAETDADGSYLLGGLPPGNYRIEFTDNEGVYSSQYFGTVVAVQAGETTTDVDAVMLAGGHVAGRVTGPGGVPLVDVDVEAYVWTNGAWQEMGWTYTDDEGLYRIQALPPGLYRLAFEDQTGVHASQVFEGARDLESGKDVQVLAGKTTADMDAMLVPGGRISGRVTHEGTPLPSILVVAFDWAGSQHDEFSETETDDDGRYTLSGLPSGTYRVLFVDIDQAQYANQAYADPVVVGAGEHVVGIDASLSEEVGGIAGTVTTVGWTEIDAIAYRQLNGTWTLMGICEIGPGGGYLIEGLAPGIYRVLFRDWTGVYKAEVFDGAADLATGTDVTVTTGAITAGIDATLTPADVAAPVFDPGGGGHVGQDIDVRVFCATIGATIRYTLDGSEPTETSPQMASNGLVIVPLPGTLKARAFKSVMEPSPVTTADYESRPAAPGGSLLLLLE